MTYLVNQVANHMNQGIANSTCSADAVGMSGRAVRRLCDRIWTVNNTIICMQC